MRHATLTLFVLVLAVAGARAQDVAVLEVEGRGVEGREPYRDGGVVEFLDVSLGAQVVHYEPGEAIQLPLSVGYRVLEPAPILLTSRLGTEHWRLYDFAAESMAAMYTDQKIDLSRPGAHTARAGRAWFGKNYGPVPGYGLVGIRGHYYLLIDQADGKWLDVTEPPAFFNQPKTLRNLVFTLADLSEFELAIDEVQSTWQPGGPLRVKVVVRDGRGQELPVVAAAVVATAGDWRSELATERKPLGEPTGWMRGRLPKAVPSQIAVSADVVLQTPEGIETRKIEARFSKGSGLVSPKDFQLAEQGYELARDADGTIRETRAVWISPSDITDAESVDRLVGRCRQAGFNVLIPDIFVRNSFYAKSELMPTTDRIEEGFDPLGDLIVKAHAAGLEVHPWFCVTYRDRHFRAWFAEKYGQNIEMLDANGKVIDYGADVHRSEYRDFIVDLMVGVARDYDVDGIHLDYIRTMGRCHCESCREEFAKSHEVLLAEADDEQWKAWQRQAIGDIVRRTAEGVRRAKPEAAMSAAVFSSMPSGAAQGQDPAGWAARGWIDLVIPMDYQMQTLQVRSNERQFLAAMEDDEKLVTGLSLYMRSGGKAVSRPADLVFEQIELVRRMGIHGYCLFALTHLSDEQLETLREKVNAEPARPYFRH